MTAYRQRKFLSGRSMSVSSCSNKCSRSAAVVESVLGYDRLLCRWCAKSARTAWQSALEPAMPRCNACDDGRLLNGAPDGVVPLMRCVDCGRDVQVAAMRSAA